MDNEERPTHRRLKADDRRQQIVETAFDTLAERGFEGFRTRDVAERAGINSATLHHYFPTKEALIVGVAAHLERLYMAGRAPQRAADEGVPAPLRALRLEFADVAFFSRKYPKTWTVSRELMLRAPRDPVVADIVTRLNEQWRASVERILADGRDAGVFPAVHDPTAAALAVVGALWGAIMLAKPTQPQFDAVCREIEAWLVGKDNQE